MIADINIINTNASKAHTRRWVNEVKRSMGVDISKIISRAGIANVIELHAADSVALITGVSGDVAKMVSGHTLSALRSGKSARQLGLELTARFNRELSGSLIGRTSETRARGQRKKNIKVKQERIAAAAQRREIKATVRMKYQTRMELIARDQSSKLNSRLNRARQEEAGIDQYKWVTARDERVRDRHRSLDGTIQKWNTPTNDGFPGDAINCRCVAIAVI